MIATATPGQAPSLWDRVQAEYECSHADRRLVWWPVGDHRCYGRQCLNCGQTGSAKKATLTAREQAGAVRKDEELQQRWWQARNRRYEELRQAELDAENAEWRRRYNAHVNPHNPEWRSLRARVLKRSGGWCEGCGERPAVEVHHLTYKHLGAEFLWELQAVCRECHERIHEAHEGSL
jgi:hypothetical protein